MDRSITAKPHSVQLRYLLSGQNGVFICSRPGALRGPPSRQRGDDLLHGGVAGHGGHLGDLRGQVRDAEVVFVGVRAGYLGAEAVIFPGQALDLLVQQGVDARLPRLVQRDVDMGGL